MCTEPVAFDPLRKWIAALRLSCSNQVNFAIFCDCKCDSLARVSADLRQLYFVELLSTALFGAFECLVLPAVQ